MALHLLLLSLFLLPLVSGVPLSPVEEEKQWILAGLSLIRRLDCSHITTISSQECIKIRVSPASRFMAHFASVETPLEPATELVITHQEEVEDKQVDGESGRLTGVLVLDPLADRAFGHPLFIFRIVAFRGSREEQLKRCLDNRGLMYRNECIHQEVKRGCPFIFRAAGHEETEFRGSNHSRVCEYQFMPRVTTTDEPEKNLLQCIRHAASCVQQRQRRRRLHRRRVLPSTYHQSELPLWRRDPHWINPLTRRSAEPDFVTARSPRLVSPADKGSTSTNSDEESICSPFNRCDFALLLSSKGEGSGTNVPHRRHLIDKLRSLGFTQDYLSVFPPEERLITPYHFFDFASKQKEEASEVRSVKEGFRNRLQKICHTPHCASTLFLYLNNFVLPNGDMLLGTSGSIINQTERYSVEEFLSDLSGCQATQVFAVVDQNFGGILLESLTAQASEFTNLVLLSATRQANAVYRKVEDDEEGVVDEDSTSEFFYPSSYALRLGHYELYGVEDLLTHALENLPLSRMLVGDIEKQIKAHYPFLGLGSFYGSRVQTLSSALFSKPAPANQHEGGFLQGHLGVYARSLNLAARRRFVAGCVTLSPIDWLRSYLPSTEQGGQRH